MRYDLTFGTTLSYDLPPVHICFLLLDLSVGNVDYL